MSLLSWDWLYSLALAFAGLALAVVNWLVGFTVMAFVCLVYAVVEFGVAFWRRENEASQDVSTVIQGFN